MKTCLAAILVPTLLMLSTPPAFSEGPAGAAQREKKGSAQQSRAASPRADIEVEIEKTRGVADRSPKPQPGQVITGNNPRDLLDIAVELLSGIRWKLLSDFAPRLLSGNKPELLSGNETELLSGNETELLSGNEPSILSENETSLLSENEASLLSDNHISLFSDINISITVTRSGNGAGDEDSD